MTKQRRQYNPEFKFKAALKAAKGRKTNSELASEMQVYPNQISDWKRLLLEESAGLFQRNSNGYQREQKSCKLPCTSKPAASRWSWSG